MLKPIRGHTTEAAPPKGARKARRYPEAELQRALVRRLRAAGQAPVFVENESPRDPAQASRWQAMGGARGVPDLLLPLRRVAIECKSPTGTVKPHQEAWHEALRDCGWLVFVARSESDVPTWVLDGKEEPADAGRKERRNCRHCQWLADDEKINAKCSACGRVWKCDPAEAKSAADARRQSFERFFGVGPA